MTIPAKYKKGVFKPLGGVQLAEGTRVEVHVPELAAPTEPQSLRDSPIFGMWADREDIPDGVTYEDRMRQPRQ
ncbi:MAG: antitoxin family protein [Acidobacteriia bacterium]|nr:antitoxin family protein [Terriglobia bacterium]